MPSTRTAERVANFTISGTVEVTSKIVDHYNPGYDVGGRLIGPGFTVMAGGKDVINELAQGDWDGAGIQSAGIPGSLAGSWAGGKAGGWAFTQVSKNPY